MEKDLEERIRLLASCGMDCARRIREAKTVVLAAVMEVTGNRA